MSNEYAEACSVACSAARNCNPEVDTWCHSAWSHASSLSFWMLHMLNQFSSSDVSAKATSEESKNKVLEAMAVWLSDHFEYALALIETEMKLTSAELATCDMIRSIIKLCPSGSVAVNAVRSCISDFFQGISPKLKDPVDSNIPYPICSYFAHALVALLFPNPLDVADAPVSLSQFLAIADAPAVRSVFGVSATTFNAIFSRQVASASSKKPTIDLMRKLIAMVPSSHPARVVHADWEVLFQTTARKSTAQILLDLLKNHRNTIVTPSESPEKSLDLIEEVHTTIRSVSSHLTELAGRASALRLEFRCAEGFVARNCSRHRRIYRPAAQQQNRAGRLGMQFPTIRGFDEAQRLCVSDGDI